MQGARDAAVADHAHRLIVEQVGADVAVPQILLFASAHQPVAISDFTTGGDGQAQREFGHLARETRRRAQDADAAAIALLVIQTLGKTARDIHDGAQLPGAIQHIAIMPAGADQRLGLRQRAQKRVPGHALVLAPNHIDQVAQALLVVPARRFHPSGESWDRLSLCFS